MKPSLNTIRLSSFFCCGDLLQASRNIVNKAVTILIKTPNVNIHLIEINHHPKISQMCFESITGFNQFPALFRHGRTRVGRFQLHFDLHALFFILNGFTFGFEIFSTRANFRMLSANPITYDALFLTGSRGRTFAAAALSLVAQNCAQASINFRRFSGMVERE